MNWEAFAIMGGGSLVLLLLIVVPLLYFLRRRDHARPDRSPEPAISRAGLSLMAVFVVLLIGGKMLETTLAGRLSAIERLLIDVVYFGGLILGFTLLFKALERRGVRFYRQQGADPGRTHRDGS